MDSFPSSPAKGGSADGGSRFPALFDLDGFDGGPEFGATGSLGGWSAPSTARSIAIDAPVAAQIEYDAESLANTLLNAAPSAVQLQEGQPAAGGARATGVPFGVLAGQFERHILTLQLHAHDPGKPDQTHERIRSAVLAGADVNLADDSGVPPLSLSARLGLVESCRELLDLGADPNGRDRLGNTALHDAYVTTLYPSII